MSETDTTHIEDTFKETNQETPQQVSELPPPAKRDRLGQIYATGKRKCSIARVWLKSGTGQITINKRSLETYFARPTLRMVLKQPLIETELVDRYDVKCFVTGGGLSGQARAIRHGIAKSLSRFDPALRVPIQALGLLTRDSRIVERKKYGHRKARRRFQFSKR